MQLDLACTHKHPHLDQHITPTHKHTYIHHSHTHLLPLPLLLSTHKASWTKLEVVKVKDLLELLRKSYASQKSKNIEFLLMIEQLVRRMKGGRLTSCKSGKDRTGMSVTLEECCLLRSDHHLKNETFDRTLSTLRRSVVGGCGCWGRGWVWVGGSVCVDM